MFSWTHLTRPRLRAQPECREAPTHQLVRAGEEEFGFAGQKRTLSPEAARMSRWLRFQMALSCTEQLIRSARSCQPTWTVLVPRLVAVADCWRHRLQRLSRLLMRGGLGRRAFKKCRQPPRTQSQPVQRVAPDTRARRGP
jgi:hypothetical protein